MSIITADSLQRIGPHRLPSNSTSRGGENFDRIQDAVVSCLKGEWPRHRGKRKKSSWKDVQQKRLRLSTADLERIARSPRPKAQRAIASVIEILTALRRERRQGERRRLA